MTDPARMRPVLRESYAQPVMGGREPTNLGDILERVLDRGVVIAGDIRVNLLDIELLTIKLRLLIASVDTARELGIDWWEHDPWLTGENRELTDENRRLRDRLAEVERRLNEQERLMPPRRPAISREAAHDDEYDREYAREYERGDEAEYALDDDAEHEAGHQTGHQTGRRRRGEGRRD
ncbi:hypothetical protein Pth03_78570 [Planotetraspora thailandica]|uniref:Gas vesicle structural protein n=1 Tax=Planotetraspora thailandica TaxID=487172 RepID=A0A8J3Y244_9ACTN|nr:gas vesicle protein GvpJ [Planotetraspora thailandica]GII59468.1 hypothetical protein Pth03_78570 [Planotetraspora thailandica]